MKIQPIFVDAVGHLIFSTRFWEDAKQFVTDAESGDFATGAEKKAKVIADLRTVFSDLSNFALNLGIELAKLWLASQSPDFGKLVNEPG